MTIECYRNIRRRNVTRKMKIFIEKGYFKVPREENWLRIEKMLNEVFKPTEAEWEYIMKWMYGKKP